VTAERRGRVILYQLASNQITAQVTAAMTAVRTALLPGLAHPVTP
jgi:hypothetical protein